MLFGGELHFLERKPFAQSILIENDSAPIRLNHRSNKTECLVVWRELTVGEFETVLT